MTTRVMIWNIKSFSTNKLYDTGKKISNNEKDAPAKKQRLTDLSLSRSIDIQSVVQCVDPDVFIVLEVVSEQGELGTLVGGEGAIACLTLLHGLRTFNNMNWNLVPPLKLVGKEFIDQQKYTEAQAVFFRSDKLNFQGPYIWPKDHLLPGFGKVPVPDDGNTQSGPYPPPWDQVLPENNYYAGQYKYVSYQDGKELRFPDSTSRNPFLTQFVEIGGMGRTITILSVHSPPKNEIVSAFSRIFSIKEIYQQKPLEVIAVGGDININLFGSAL